MDPNPIKHPAVLLAHIRDAVEPILQQAGFRFESRNNPRDRARTHLWIDYVGGQQFVSLRWDRWKATVSLELVNARGQITTIADVCMDGVRSSRDITERIDEFVQTVQRSESLKT